MGRPKARRQQARPRQWYACLHHRWCARLVDAATFAIGTTGRPAIPFRPRSVNSIAMTVRLASHRQSPRPSTAGRLESSAHGAPAHLPAPLPPLRLVPQPEGLLQIHTAPFRGSFAAVFSQALRTAGLGSRVLVSQFLKGGVDQGVAGSLWLCGRLEWLRPATPQCIDTPLTLSPLQPGAHRPEAGSPGLVSRQEAADGELATAAALVAQTLEAVTEVWAYSRTCLLEGSVDLMVLDELGLAIELGYLAADEVTATLERRPAQLDVILTGPSMPAALMAMADQVTQLRRAP